MDSERQFIITKTPLRVSLGGGGTDLPFYASERGGFLITAAIDEYITVSVASRPLDDKVLVQTTSSQLADSIAEVTNRVIAAVLRYFNRTSAIQVATFSTVPTGIGLGSSSTQIVGMVHALAALNGQVHSPTEIAAIAYRIERHILKMAGGVQDQYISALGGIQILKVDVDGTVSAEPLLIDGDCLRELETRLVLVYSGRQRDSSDVVKSQEVESARKFEIYDEIKEIGKRSVKLIQNGDVLGFGQIMDEHWQLKRQLSKEISDTDFDRQYEELKSLGASGGKLVGAGGGGFFMMAVPGDVDRYLFEARSLGYRHLDWNFEFEGVHIINQTPAPNRGTEQRNSDFAIKL